MRNTTRIPLIALSVLILASMACTAVGPGGFIYDTTKVSVVEVTVDDNSQVSQAPSVSSDAPAAATQTTYDPMDNVARLLADMPYDLVKQVNEDGRTVTTLKGFDLNEWGGTNDPGCTRTELDEVMLNEEVGSADENCVIIAEWSLKTDDGTHMSGFFATHPREWFRLSYAMANGETRFVGTLHYVPFGWNGHMLAADMAGDWQIKNPGELTIVGLSPTDAYVQQVWAAAEAVHP